MSPKQIKACLACLTSLAKSPGRHALIGTTGLEQPQAVALQNPCFWSFGFFRIIFSGFCLLVCFYMKTLESSVETTLVDEISKALESCYLK